MGDARRPRVTLIELTLALSSLALLPVAGPLASGTALGGSALLAWGIRRSRRTAEDDARRRRHGQLLESLDPLDPLLLTSVAGYLLVERLEAGRFRALPESSLDPDQAILVLLLEGPDEERLLRELRPWREAIHPLFSGYLGHLAREPGQYLVAFERAERTFQELAPYEVSAVFASLLEGLAACWRLGMDPGPLAPDRLELRRGQPRLAFRFSWVDPRLCRSGLPSPRGMAPERLMGGPVQEAATQFEVGLALYEALTGRPPFGASDPLQHILQLLQDDPPALELGRPELEDLVLRLLARDPAARFAGLQAVQESLRLVLP